MTVIILSGGGILVMGLVLWTFLWRGGYAELEEFPDSVEHAHLRRVAEARIAVLCPGAILLAERERADGRGSGGDSGREFWRRFAAASALVEEDPIAAIRELRRVSDLLEEALAVQRQNIDVAEGAPTLEDGP